MEKTGHDHQCRREWVNVKKQRKVKYYFYLEHRQFTRKSIQLFVLFCSELLNPNSSLLPDRIAASGNRRRHFLKLSLIVIRISLSDERKDFYRQIVNHRDRSADMTNKIDRMLCIFLTFKGIIQCFFSSIFKNKFNCWKYEKEHEGGKTMIDVMFWLVKIFLRKTFVFSPMSIFYLW